MNNFAVFEFAEVGRLCAHFYSQIRIQNVEDKFRQKWRMYCSCCLVYSSTVSSEILQQEKWLQFRITTFERVVICYFKLLPTSYMKKA